MRVIRGITRLKPILKEVVTVDEGGIGTGCDYIVFVEQDDLTYRRYIFFFHYLLPPLSVSVAIESSRRVDFYDALVTERDVNRLAVSPYNVGISVEDQRAY